MLLRLTKLEVKGTDGQIDDFDTLERAASLRDLIEDIKSGKANKKITILYKITVI